VDRRVALLHEPCVVLVLPGQPGSDLCQDSELVAPVHAPRHALRVVHAYHQRLAALLA